MRIVNAVVREETYCFTPGGGDPIHIRSGRLREWLHANAMDKIIDLTFPAQTELEMIEQFGLERPRMDSMTMFEASDPIIVGMWPADDTHILIDGAHRRWFWNNRGIHKLRGWAVPYDVWKTFIFDPKTSNIISYHDSGAMLPQRRKS